MLFFCRRLWALSRSNYQEKDRNVKENVWSCTTFTVQVLHSISFEKHHLTPYKKIVGIMCSVEVNSSGAV